MLTTEQIKQTVSDYFKDKPVKKVYLFGLYARGEANEESDVDLLVELDYSKKIGLKFYGWYVDPEDVFLGKVDVVPADCLYDDLRTAVERDKIQLLSTETIAAWPKQTKAVEEIFYRIDKIKDYISGVSEDDFYSNELLKDACHANLIIVSEAMAGTGAEVKINYQELSWREIIGFRNLIVHKYFRINWRTVWQIITDDLRSLESSVQKIINRIE